jgi:hypothetical protein
VSGAPRRRLDTPHYHHPEAQQRVPPPFTSAVTGMRRLRALAGARRRNRRAAEPVSTSWRPI